jgi:two-component system, chemotaxis family, chemotaxis protein CheY
MLARVVAERSTLSSRDGPRAEPTDSLGSREPSATPGADDPSLGRSEFRRAARAVRLPFRGLRCSFVAEILVVDDSKVMRDMVVACLRGRERLRFTHAASGLEAIERLSLATYDLVVLDLNMPDIGGIEVLEFVRAQDKLRELPILVVTTRGDEASRERALGAGASAFMTKPFTPEGILERVDALLGESTGRT